MAFDPYGDLTDVWKRISGDAEVKSLLGLSTASQTELAKAIVKRREVGALANSDKRVCIFKPPSRRNGRNADAPEQLVEVDVYVPAADSHVAQRVIGRIHTLLHKQDVGKCVLYYDAHLGDQPTTAGFYCDAIRFSYYSII